VAVQNTTAAADLRIIQQNNTAATQHKCTKYIEQRVATALATMIYV